MKYDVYFRPSGSYTFSVEIPDDEVPEDEDLLLDRIMDEAYDNVPTGVCAQCSGWHQDWSLDFGDPEIYAVESAEGNILMEEKL